MQDWLKRKKISIVVILLMGIFIELFFFNFRYFLQNVLNLPSMTIGLEQTVKKDFEIVGPSTFRSTSDDPNLEIRDLNKSIMSISLDLDYRESGGVLQVFYSDEHSPNYSEDKSWKLPIYSNQKNYSILLEWPHLIKNMRIDLTNRNSDTVKINSIILNPVIAFDFNFKRLLYIYIWLVSLYMLFFLIKRYWELIIRYRYIFALITFLLLVICKLHGSSIGMWDQYLTSKISENKSTVLFGHERAIRSDEWLVHTPWIFSQVENEKFFPVKNNNIRSEGQNMILPNTPTLSLDLLGKPYYWGFVLFGKEYGLSWYWNFKQIVLILLSFEISMYLSNRNRILSVVGALWIGYSPVIQWWYDTPASVVELIIYSQAIIVTAIYYVKYPDKVYLRYTNLVLMSLSIIGFVTILYPAVQVPLGYLTLIFLLFILYPNRKKLFIRRKEILFGVFCLLFIMISIIRFLALSWDDLKVILGTVYPGARHTNGGEYDPNFLHLYLINWLLPFKDINFLNNSSASNYYSFIPALLLVFFKVYKLDDERKNLITALFSYLLFQLSWLFVSYPPIIGKLTLFSFVPEPRLATMTMGLTAVYLSIWLVSVIAKHKPLGIYESFMLSFLVGIIYFYSIKHSPMIGYLTFKFAVFALLFFVLLNFLLLRGNLKFFLINMMVLIFVSGATVNPISRGIDSLYNKRIVSEILEVNKVDPNEKWVATNSLVNGQLLVALGIKSFNSVHFYPDLKLWKRLDGQRKYEDIYNRYAHVYVSLTNKETTFKLIQTDYFEVNLNINDLKKEGVKYIFSKGLPNRSVVQGIKQIYSEPDDDLYIYEVMK